MKIDGHQSLIVKSHSWKNQRKVDLTAYKLKIISKNKRELNREAFIAIPH